MINLAMATDAEIKADAAASANGAPTVAGFCEYKAVIEDVISVVVPLIPGLSLIPGGSSNVVKWVNAWIEAKCSGS